MRTGEIPRALGLCVAYQVWCAIKPDAQRWDHLEAYLRYQTRTSQIRHLAEAASLQFHIAVQSMLREYGARETGHATNPRTWLLNTERGCSCMPTNNSLANAVASSMTAHRDMELVRRSDDMPSSAVASRNPRSTWVTGHSTKKGLRKLYGHWHTTVAEVMRVLVYQLTPRRIAAPGWAKGEEKQRKSKAREEVVECKKAEDSTAVGRRARLAHKSPRAQRPTCCSGSHP